jgi:TetR/AcrR family transcriptional regulator, cholesterol catabolism regulator
MFADASVAGEIRAVGMRLTTMIARAVSDSPDQGEVTEEEAAVIRVIADVWLSALVGWVSGRSEAAGVEQQTDVAVRLLLR